MDPSGPWRRRIARGLAIFGCAIVLYFILPPLLTSNFIFRGYLENCLEEEIGYRAELGDIKVTAWTGQYKIAIPTLDFFEPWEGGQPVASLDQISCEMYPWELLRPFFALRKGALRNLEIVGTSKRLKAFLKKFPYFSLENLPILEAGDDSLILRKLTYSLQREDSALRFSLDSGVECRSLVKATLSCAGLFYPREHRLALDRFDFGGQRHTISRTIIGGRIKEEQTDVPFNFSFKGIVSQKRLKMEDLSFKADKLHFTGDIAVENATLSFNLDGQGDFSQKMADLFQISSRISHFDGLVCHLNGQGDPKSGCLTTKGEMRFPSGIMAGVSLSNACLNFTAKNDHLTDLNLTSIFWQGQAQLKALEDSTTDGQKLLKASLDLKNLAIPDMLNHFGCPNKMQGGTGNLDATLYLTNGTLSAFLDNGEETLSKIYGSGTVSAHDVNLAYFTGDEWLSGQAPLILQRLLGTGATIATAKEELPFLQQIMQSLSKEKLRDYTASFSIRNGAVRSPATLLSGKLGELLASGECSLKGDLDYALNLKLNQSLSEHYGKQPLASMFMQDKNIVIPISLKGTINKPKATLNLTEDQRKEFEERTLKLVTDFYQDKLKDTAGRFLKEKDMDDVMQKIESSVKELLKKLL